MSQKRVEKGKSAVNHESSRTERAAVSVTLRRDKRKGVLERGRERGGVGAAAPTFSMQIANAEQEAQARLYEAQMRGICAELGKLCPVTTESEEMDEAQQVRAALKLHEALTLLRAFAPALRQLIDERGVFFTVMFLMSTPQGKGADMLYAALDLLVYVSGGNELLETSLLVPLQAAPLLFRWAEVPNEVVQITTLTVLANMLIETDRISADMLSPRADVMQREPLTLAETVMRQQPPPTPNVQAALMRLVAAAMMSPPLPPASKCLEAADFLLASLLTTQDEGIAGSVLWGIHGLISAGDTRVKEATLAALSPAHVERAVHWLRPECSTQTRRAAINALSYAVSVADEPTAAAFDAGIIVQLRHVITEQSNYMAEQALVLLKNLLFTSGREALVVHAYLETGIFAACNVAPTMGSTPMREYRSDLFACAAAVATPDDVMRMLSSDLVKILEEGIDLPIPKLQMDITTCMGEIIDRTAPLAKDGVNPFVAALDSSDILHKLHSIYIEERIATHTRPRTEAATPGRVAESFLERYFPDDGDDVVPEPEPKPANRHRDTPPEQILQNGLAKMLAFMDQAEAGPADDAMDTSNQ